MSEPRSIELTTSPPEDDDLEEVALSNQRFLQLLVFAAACFMSTQNHTCMAPVYALAEARFHTSQRGVNAIANIWVRAVLVAAKPHGR